MQLPINELKTVSPDALAKAGISPRTVQRILDATTRAAALRTEAQALTPRLRASGELMAAMEAFAHPLEHLQ